MSGRIAARFAALRRDGRGALITYLSAGDPDPATSRDILFALPEAGADLLEIGMPFTDPMADGPAIQRAGLRALRAGMTLPGVLELVREFRERDDATPVILMGYLNPVHAYGVARFCADAAAAGVDGLIVVDVPPEEADVLAPQAAETGLDLIRLVAPTTGDARLPRVLQATTGFVYFVSITGTTGTASASAASLEAAIPRLRAHTALPIVIGFGIRTPEQAATAVRTADAAVVGTALVEALAGTLDGDDHATGTTVAVVLDRVRELARAVRSARA